MVQFVTLGFLQLAIVRRYWLHKTQGHRLTCTPMDSRIWPSKSRTTSSNIHTAAM